MIASTEDGWVMAKQSKYTKSEKKSAKRRSKDAPAAAPASVSGLLRLPPGPVDLRSYDARATPGFDGGKADGRAELAELRARFADLQERLIANGRSGDQRRLLLVLQGMDPSGKGGTVRHVVGSGDPGGLAVTAFKAPTPEERRHDFLWRIRRAFPEPGHVGVFDRSHYEDVLVVRVKSLVEPPVWKRRYSTINRVEERLVASGCTVIKVMLHISPEEQQARLLARLEDPTKYWKYQPGDVNERALWPQYQEAYEAALERCNTESAPWFVVPADRKWYRNWAVSQLLIEHLEAMELQWPPPKFDVEAEKARVLASNPTQ
jgi:PPK2 family polyphosphate:nucleotide phosphotransferase